MARRDPVWSVYRRTFEGFDLVGAVSALTAGHAAELGRKLPDAPLYPVVAHAHPSIKRAFVLVEKPAEDDRRSRRRAA